MARRIREFNWDDHPFGPPETWPQSLRSALSICLQSAFPTAIYWGSDLRLLYNDAWAPIPGPRHPAALGAPAREVWSDIWHIIEPQFIHLITTGDGIFVEDQMLPMKRFGVTEETYWSYSFTPIRGEDGAIHGVYNAGSETTRSVLSQRQMRFLLEFGETFRNEADLRQARRSAIAMLGEHLGVARVGLREIVPGTDDRFDVTDEWTRPEVSPAGSSINLTGLGPWASECLKSGHVLRIDDVAKNEDLGESRRVFEAMGVGAAMAVPWAVGGRTIAMIFLHSREPRQWSDFDVSTSEEVLSRILAWSERERAAERERIMTREIDHRARNALAAVQSVIRLTTADNVTDFKEKIEDRIAAFARSHALLSAEQWKAIELGALLRDELAPYIETDSGRVATQGPAIALRPDQAQTVALLLHELTTNAAKYGALKDEDGRLDVTWSAGPDNVLEIVWREHSPSVGATKSSRIGFGSTLLSRVVEQQLGGTISRRLESDGLECEIAIPLSPPDKSRPSRPTAVEQRDAEPQPTRSGVLIVEDEALVAMDLETMFENLGYEIFSTAPSVKHALAALENGTPQFAIVDMNLSGDSSLPVAEELCKRGVPLVFATGYAEPGDLPPHLAGFPRLSKPISEKDLVRTVGEISANNDG